MPLEVTTPLHFTFRSQLGLSKKTTWMNSCGSFKRGGPGFVAAVRSWGGESWGALACPSCQSAATEVPNPDLSTGSEECTTLSLSETEKNHIPSIRLISDQAGKGFCLQSVPSSLWAALVRCKHYFLVEFCLALFCRWFIHPTSLSSLQMATLRSWMFCFKTMEIEPFVSQLFLFVRRTEVSVGRKRWGWSVHWRSSSNQKNQSA